MSGAAGWARRRPAAAYFVLAFGIAWAGAAMVAGPYWVRGEAAPKFTGLMMFPAMIFGPAGAGLWMTWVVEGRAGLRALGRRLGRVGVGRWWAMAAAPPAAALAALGTLTLLVGPQFKPNHFWIGLSFGAAAGIVEEIGWMGFAYPAMRAGRSGFRVAAALGLLWALWHAPVIDYLGSATPHGRYLPAFFAAFALAMTGLRVMMCAVYEKTGSVALAQAMHAASTGSLAALGPVGITAGQEALWYAGYGVVLWIIASAAAALGWGRARKS